MISHTFPGDRNFKYNSGKCVRDKKVRNKETGIFDVNGNCGAHVKRNVLVRFLYMFAI